MSERVPGSDLLGKSRATDSFLSTSLISFSQPTRHDAGSYRSHSVLGTSGSGR